MMMNKSELREIHSLRRKAISREKMLQLSQSIADAFFTEIDLTHSPKLHIYLPIEKQNEINTWLIINHIREHHPDVQIILPKTDFKEISIQSFVFNSSEDIVTNHLGIPEPAGGDEVKPEDLDIVVAPMLTYDLRGMRLGYGMGFYDRFFSRCRPDVLKVGLSWDDPVESIDDIDKFDIALDVVVTPGKIYKFKTVS